MHSRACRRCQAQAKSKLPEPLLALCWSVCLDMARMSSAVVSAGRRGVFALTCFPRVTQLHWTMALTGANTLPCVYSIVDGNAPRSHAPSVAGMSVEDDDSECDSMLPCDVALARCAGTQHGLLHLCSPSLGYGQWLQGEVPFAHGAGGVSKHFVCQAAITDNQ